MLKVGEDDMCPKQYGVLRARSYAASLFILLTTCARAAEPAHLPPSDEMLARAACSACHLFPDPRLLDKTIWPEYIFPKMRLYMGWIRWM